MKPLVSTSNDTQRAGFSATARTGTVVFHLAQGFDIDQDEQRYEFSHSFDPAALPKHVVIKTRVYSEHARRKSGSAAFIAALRRREASKVAKLIVELASHADDQHFIARTHLVLENVRRAIQNLADAEENADPAREGNACEIFREVRDSLLNGGYQKYRDPNVTKAVANILIGLSRAEVVDGEAVNSAMDTLFDLGLEPGAGLAFLHGEETEILD